MIQANECRIGNWIFNDDVKMEYQLTSYGILTLEQSPENRSPIPLTPEILEKIGERKAVLGDSTIHWKIGDFLYSENCFHLSKGLHWLQNYHYFRTGEELTFKP